jgi:hypothetical protein
MSGLVTSKGPVCPPLWTPLRRGITSTETAPHALGFVHGGAVGAGLNAEGYRWGLIRCRVASGDPAGQLIRLQPVFWDDVLEKFVAEGGVAAITFQQSSGNLPGQVRFNAYGRIFSVILTTNAAGLTIDVDGAVFGGPDSYSQYD